MSEAPLCTTRSSRLKGFVLSTRLLWLDSLWLGTGNTFYVTPAFVQATMPDLTHALGVRLQNLSGEAWRTGCTTGSSMQTSKRSMLPLFSLSLVPRELRMCDLPSLPMDKIGCMLCLAKSSVTLIYVRSGPVSSKCYSRALPVRMKHLQL